jgi:hypothetical protein
MKERADGGSGVTLGRFYENLICHSYFAKNFKKLFFTVFDEVKFNVLTLSHFLQFVVNGKKYRFEIFYSLLGDTIEKIAWQKAGIMKRNRPTFIDSDQHQVNCQIVSLDVVNVFVLIKFSCISMTRISKTFHIF